MAENLILTGPDGSNYPFLGVSSVSIRKQGGGRAEYGTGGGGGLFGPLVDRSIESITAEDLAGITEIGSHAFEECWSLYSVSLPSGLQSIGASSFDSCPIQGISLPSTLEVIDSYAFRGTSLQSVTIPSSLQRLGVGTFAYTRLTNLVIPEVVDTGFGVGFDASEVASGCGYLQSIDLPSTTEYMVNGPFFMCSALTEIICRASTPPYVDNTTFTYRQWTLPTNQVTIFVPSGSVTDYRAAQYWGNYNIKAIPT